MRACPSPNFGPRRGGVAPHLIVLHYTAMPSAADARARLCDPVAEVSAHYLIDLDGTLWSLVPEEARAWHAGAGAWAGCADVNSASIGIELQNRGDHPYPLPQIAALCALVGDLRARHAIAPQGVIGHADLAPTRKADPGPRFDWRALARAGPAVWAAPAALAGLPQPEHRVDDAQDEGRPHAEQQQGQRDLHQRHAAVAPHSTTSSRRRTRLPAR
ncbi:MAG: N-acetylmuramoyl-L-alanine amidase [Gemmobacter sp.]